MFTLQRPVKQSLGFPLQYYLPTHVEAAYFRPGVLVIPGHPSDLLSLLSTQPRARTTLETVPRLSLPERAGRRRSAVPQKHHLTTGHRYWVS